MSPRTNAWLDIDEDSSRSGRGVDGDIVTQGSCLKFAAFIFPTIFGIGLFMLILLSFSDWFVVLA